MNILQHDPMPFFVPLLDPSLGDLVLALAEGDVEERFAWLDSEAISLFLDDLFHLFDGIGTWGQDEEDRDLWFRVVD